MEQVEIGVIGGGLAGLTVARGASEAGHSVVVLDKGRGIGGRLATRRAGEAGQFDHGAQYLRPKSAAFREWLQAYEATAALAQWPAVDGAYVGLPGMTGFAKEIARGLTVRNASLVAEVHQDAGFWIASDRDGAALMRCRHLVLAIPAPQAATLLGAAHPFASALNTVDFTPCWALMVGFERAPDLPATLRDPDEAAILAWIAQDNLKPGRGQKSCLVVHAGAAWSRKHLEEEAAQVQARLLQALAERQGAALPPISHVAAHRWRYAITETPLGSPCLSDAEAGLYLCGDWCLGGRAEHAWMSAQAVLRELLDPAALRA